MRIRKLQTTLSLPRYTGKTLAVLSCALALLASHPLMAEVGVKEKPAAVRSIQDASVRPAVNEPVWNGVEGEWSPEVSKRKLYAGGSASSKPLSKQPQLLAFIAQWSQLLWGNIVPQGGAEMLLALAPVAFSEVGRMACSEVRCRTVIDLPPPCERVFVQQHCLLPPPRGC